MKILYLRTKSQKERGLYNRHNSVQEMLDCNIVFKEVYNGNNKRKNVGSLLGILLICILHANEI